MSYTELQVTSNFSFLRGASHPHELVEQAAAYGYKQIAITDHNTLVGIVRAHVAAKEQGIRLIPGCWLDLLNGPSLLAYPINLDAYSRLSTLLTIGNLRAEKGSCYLYKSDMYQYAEDMIFIVIPPAGLNANFDLQPEFEKALQEYQKALGKQLYLGATRAYQGDDHKRLFRLSQLSAQLNIPMVSTNDVHYHESQRRELQDILTCIREKCSIHTAGFKLHSNAERYLKTQEEMQRLEKEFIIIVIKDIYLNIFFYILLLFSSIIMHISKKVYKLKSPFTIHLKVIHKESLLISSLAVIFNRPT